MGRRTLARRMGTMRRVFLFALLAAALVAAPAARLAAAAPCSGPAGMDCCAGTSDDDGPPPCHCALKTVPPTPAAVDATAVPAVVLAEAAQPVIAPRAPSTVEPALPVSPRARPAPLHVLYSVFLV
jgi:hypothetical protein